MAQPFVIREYKEGDETDIVKLMGLCFDRTDFEYWMRHWIWEYNENPLGKLINVVEHNRQIIAHTSLVPINVKIRNKIYKSGITTYAMTHPNFRRRGLQRKMHASRSDELVKARIFFSYWFPEEIFLKHGTKGVDYTCKLSLMMKFFDTRDTVRKYVGSKFLSQALSAWLNLVFGVFLRSKATPISEGVTITKITQFDNRINGFWRNVSQYFDLIVVRDKEYLNWRYFKRPDSSFTVLLAEDDEKILGYIIFTSRDQISYIVDLLVLPYRLDVVQSLVSMAIEQLQEEKVNRITCLMLRNNPYYNVLQSNGFIPTEPMQGFGVSILSPSKVPTEFIKNPNNWYLTLGDTNGIIIDS